MDSTHADDSDADDRERDTDKPPVALPQAHYRPLLSVAVSAAAGVTVDRSLERWDANLWPWWGSLAALSILLWWAARQRAWTGAGWWTLGSVAFVAGAWHHLSWNYFPADDLALYAFSDSQPACIEAVLCDAPLITPAEPPNPLRVRPLGPITEATVEPLAIRDGNTWRACGGRSRLRIAGELPALQAGDRICVFAKFGRPSPPLNPGQHDWRAVERSRRRLSEIYCSSADCVQVVEPSRRWLARGVGDLRDWCRRQLAECVGPDAAPLALAVVLGAREQLSDAQMESYFHTGTIHLLVISGLHVGMLAGLAWWLAGLASGRQGRRIAITAAAVLLYAAVAGPRPPVIRAAVLVMSLLAALAAGRRASRLNLLAAAALAVIAYNPTELFRAGTQLSFLSAAALLAMSRWLGRPRPIDPLDRLLLETSPWPRRAARWLFRSWASLAAASLVVWLAALPLVGSRFHIATPIGVAITPFVWPLVATALATGLGVLSLGWLLTPLDRWLGAVTSYCLQGVQQIVALAENVPGGRAYGPGPPDWWLAALYAGVAWAALAWPRSVKWRVSWALAGIIWALAGASLVWGPRRAPHELTCTFLAMGHGVAAVVEFPHGQTILYDAGSLASPQGASRTLAEFLWSRGVRRIDAILISHADLDHFNAVPGLVEMFPVGEVCITPQMEWRRDRHDAPAVDFLFAKLARRRVDVRTVTAGDALFWEDRRVAVRVAHPPPNLPSDQRASDNAYSMVAVVEFDGRRIVLPGDLETPGLEQLTDSPRTDCDVLLAPHHGSIHSDPPGFAAWCTPEWTIVSGKQNAAAETLQHSYAREGRHVLCTAQYGAIEFRISAARLEAHAFLGEP